MWQKHIMENPTVSTGPGETVQTSGGPGGGA